MLKTFTCTRAFVAQHQDGVKKPLHHQAQTGLRSLFSKCNLMAEFSWQPVMGAAQRRRQRRLRSWWRHEQQSIAAALATVMHHSSGKVHTANGAPRSQKLATRAEEEMEYEPHYALRGQKTPPPGERPAPLSEVAGPQRSDRTVRHSAGDAPLLVVPALRGDDGVDGTTLRFLLKQNLALKKKQEEEKEKEREKEKEKEKERLAVHAEALVALERARLWSEQASRKRKRKKRRKRRTPRTSSRPSLCRTRRRPRRWHAPGWFSSAFLLALCSSLSLAGPRCSASRLFWTRRTVMRFFLTVACARLVLLVLFTSRCVFSLVCRPMMLGIKAGMDQTDILALVDTGSCMVKAGFTTGYDTSCVFLWGCRQVCDVRHHGQYGPEEHVSSYLPQVQLMDEVVVPVVCNDIWPGPAGWVPFSAAPRIWQSLVRCSLWFDSGYMLRQSTAACGRCNSWTRCACTSLCNHRCWIVWTFLLWRRGSSPWSSSSCSRCSSRTRLLLCPLLVNDRCRSSGVAVFTVVDTPLSLRSG